MMYYIDEEQTLEVTQLGETSKSSLVLAPGYYEIRNTENPTEDPIQLVYLTDNVIEVEIGSKEVC